MRRVNLLVSVLLMLCALTIRPALAGKAVKIGDTPGRALYVLSVGVDKSGEASLEAAENDARAMLTLLEAQRGGVFANVDGRAVLGGDKAAVLDGLRWIAQAPAPGDLAVVFLAGYAARASDGTAWFLPSGGTMKEARTTGLSFEEIVRALCGVKSDVLLVADVCHAGDFARQVARVCGGREQGFAALLASTSDQMAVETKTPSVNGAFTAVLLEGLSGKAVRPGAEQVTFLDVGAYAGQRLKALGMKQTPVLLSTGHVDFPLSQAK
ncbi:hypothetical protein NNJEOMEG_00068 [Fundidesulfovibrio magnetotacticus]|uniref:Peptidase C14 caspase domain-containing protein n=1 Tax=Fundidesulfovibrio magnetotacticus TaxID=2730080 RepID=A0A6V8LR55_9BACT|nr:caspase family protein [Fundidesulfovibrio magnetotacticus]GFK92246.1 hypothetical protein NNJEOMEG_00068 [Fundidesulfovibrio magnetotacticus]